MNLQRLAASALVVALTSVGLVACSSTPAPEPQEPAAIESEGTTSDPGSESRDEIIERVAPLTYEEFTGETAEVKRLYALHELGEYTDRHQVQVIAPGRGPAYYGAYVDDDKDQRKLDGQTILNNFQYVLDDARISVAEDKSLDHDRAIKVLSAGFYDTNESTAPQAYLDERADLLAHDEPYFKSGRSRTVISEDPAIEGLDADGDSVLLKDVVYVDEDGVKWNARFVCTDKGIPYTERAWLLMNLVQN